MLIERPPGNLRGCWIKLQVTERNGNYGKNGKTKARHRVPNNPEVNVSCEDGQNAVYRIRHMSMSW